MTKPALGSNTSDKGGMSKNMKKLIRSKKSKKHNNLNQ
jgi:hypothetical protein